METQPTSRISELASIIAANSAIYDKYICSQGLPSPSFDINTPFKIHVSEEATLARDVVLEASTELQALINGPLGYLQTQTLDHTNLSIQAIYRFGIPTSFPVGAEASSEQISEVCGLSEPEVRRMIRYAMTKHIVQEPSTGIIAHTAASQALTEVPSMRDWVGMVCEEMWPSAARAVDAMVKWPGSQEPNHTGFAFANNTHNATFKELGKNPTQSKRFANAVSMISTDEGYEAYHLIEAVPWDVIGARVFVDIGGSHGSASIALAQRKETIKCIVQDLPEVAAEGDLRLMPDMRGRITFMAHDFFTDQPVKGADVYYFRWIFHDWSDKYCTKILRSLIPALKSGARIIISEFIVPPPGAISLYREWLVRAFDLAMLELFNPKGRDANDWASLLRQADERFRLVGIKRPSRSKLSFVEVICEWNETLGQSL